jgi:hypothetical protein
MRLGNKPHIGRTEMDVAVARPARIVAKIDASMTRFTARM